MPVEFEFRLETNEGIAAERAIAVTAALVRAIRTLPTFPEDGQIEIVDAGRGSFRAKLALYSSLVGAFAGVGSFAKDIVDLLKQPDTELAQCVAWTMVEDGVTKAGISCAGDYEVLKHEMPAVARLVVLRDEISRHNEKGEFSRVSTALDKMVVGASADRTILLDSLPDHSTFTNIPPAPEVAQLPGRFGKSAGGLFFVQPDGQVGLLEEDFDNQELPLNVPVIARLSAVRGPRGGWADRRIRVKGWTAPGEEYPIEEQQIARHIWRRGGDDEEVDLTPGQQSDDLRTVSDPGRDLYDERASIEQQPVAAFIGELEKQGKDVLLVTDGGDTFVLEGDVDYPDESMQRKFVAIGRAGLEADDLGRRRLLVDQMLPVSSE